MEETKINFSLIHNCLIRGVTEKIEKNSEESKIAEI